MSLSGLAGRSGRPLFNLSAASAGNSQHLWRWHILLSLPPADCLSPLPPPPHHTRREFSLGFIFLPPVLLPVLKSGWRCWSSAGRPAGPHRSAPPLIAASHVLAFFPAVFGHSAANFPLFCWIGGGEVWRWGASAALSLQHTTGVQLLAVYKRGLKKAEGNAKSTKKSMVWPAGAARVGCRRARNCWLSIWKDA